MPRQAYGVTQDLQGILVVDKPSGITSYDVLRRLKPVLRSQKSEAGSQKLGHAGTLDPLAEGVLLVLIGAATKIARYLEALDKEYEATVRLGIRTDTDDITGRVIEERPVPELTASQLAGVLREFKGEIYQQPPAFSALKLKGVPAYDLARTGQQFTLPPRRVRVKELDLLALAGSTFSLRAVVSKGTYIRALARDIGARLACGATLQALKRTRVGEFRIAQAIALDAIDSRRIAEGLISTRAALNFMPYLHVKPVALTRLRNGIPLGPDDLMDELPAGASRVCLADPDERMLVVSRCEAGVLRPERGVVVGG